MVGVAGAVASLLPTHGLFVPNFRQGRFRVLFGAIPRCLAVSSVAELCMCCCTTCVQGDGAK